MGPGEFVPIGYRCIRFSGSQSFGMVAYHHVGRLTLFEVRLHGVRNDGTTIPSETVELYWFDVKKIFFRR